MVVAGSSVMGSLQQRLRVRCVGAIVHDEGGRLLMVQRGQEPAAGSWSIPGGRVEPGESDHQAVVREVFEETGLMVEPGVLAGTVERDGLAGSIYEIYDYVCAVCSGDPQAASDAADVRWVTASELVRLPTAPGLRESLAAWGQLPSGGDP
jgi:8-oxo-dGTP diphosphatase